MKKIISLIKKSLFWKIYFIVIGVFIVALIGGSVLFSMWLSDYESSQNTVEVEKVISMFKNEQYSDIILRTDVVKAGLADPNAYEARLRESVQGKELTYIKAFSYDRFASPSYIIKAGGEDLCKLTLKKSNISSRFGFNLYEFDYISDFAFSDINVVFLAPEGAVPYIDGKKVDDIFKKTLAKDQPASTSYNLSMTPVVINRYEISGLLAEPESVEVRGEGGKAMELKINTDNEIVAQTLGVYINAPIGYKVRMNGVLLSSKYITGSASENPDAQYLINEEDINYLSRFYTYYVDGLYEVPEVDVTDEIDEPVMCVYNKETCSFNVGVKTYTILAPSNYKVYANGIEISASDKWLSDKKAAEGLNNIPAEYLAAPEMITYKVSVLTTAPDIEFRNYDGEPVQAEYDDETMTYLCDFAPADSVIDEYTQVAISGAKAYAGFMTNDISMNEFLSRIVKNTQMYKDMSEYRQYFYTDHNSTSFENLETYEMRTYTKDCFSCAVYFDYWIFGQRGKPDFQTKLETNTRIWYVRTDEGWKMADIEIFKKG